MKRPLISVLGLCALLSGCGGAAATSEPASTTTAVEETQQPIMAAGELTPGGTVANFGVHHLTTGFMPDPYTVDVVSGGGIDASTSNAGAGCAGWVTGQPDVIVNFEEMSGFLRFAFRPSADGADATLVINDGQGNWHCNDDASGLNPVVDLADAPPGQYDIWIGSYNSEDRITGQLLVTELSDVMP